MIYNLQMMSMWGPTNNSLVTSLVKNSKDACVCTTLLCIAYTSYSCSATMSLKQYLYIYIYTKLSTKWLCLYLLFLRVQPISGKVSSVTQLQPEELPPSSMSRKKRAQHLYFNR